jgi:hypothetical protein
MLELILIKYYKNVVSGYYEYIKFIGHEAQVD